MVGILFFSFSLSSPVRFAGGGAKGGRGVFEAGGVIVDRSKRFFGWFIFFLSWGGGQDKKSPFRIFPPSLVLH